VVFAIALELRSSVRLPRNARALNMLQMLHKKHLLTGDLFYLSLAVG